MAILILGVLITLAVIIMEWCDDYFDIGEMLFFNFLTLIIGALITLGIMLIASVFVPKYFTYGKYRLMALQDNSSVSAAFYLGSGVIDGNFKYTYYQNNGKSAELKSVDAEGVQVYQDSDKAYVVQQTDCKSKMSWLAYCISDGSVTEIHVPKGTIRQNYTLDAKN